MVLARQYLQASGLGLVGASGQGQVGCMNQVVTMVDQISATDGPLGVASTGLEDVHSAGDVDGRVELPHHAKGIGHQLLIVLGLDQDPSSFQIHDMKVVAIHQHSVSSAAKGMVQGLQTCIHVDLNHAFAGLLDQLVDEFNVLHGHVEVIVWVIVGVDRLTPQQLF